MSMVTTSRNRKIFALFLSLLFPGLGHVVLRRYFRGFFWSFLFASFLEGFLWTLFVRPGVFASWTVGVFIAMIFAYAGAQVFLLFDLSQLHEIPAERRKALFREILIAFLKNDLKKAREILDQILSTNADDFDAHFHLGHLLLLEGNIPGARREFSRCEELDDSGKWTWLISQELKHIGPEPRVESRE